MFDNQKAREARLRRLARKMGLRLEKTRSPHFLRFGGYMVLDDRNIVVDGASGNAYSSDLDRVEWFLTEYWPNK